MHQLLITHNAVLCGERRAAKRVQPRVSFRGDARALGYVENPCKTPKPLSGAIAELKPAKLSAIINNDPILPSQLLAHHD